MTRKFHKLKLAVGAPDVRMHDLRHQAATVFLNSRISPRIGSERLGHSRTSTTLDIYAQFLPAADREATDILGALPALAEPARMTEPAAGRRRGRRRRLVAEDGGVSR